MVVGRNSIQQKMAWRQVFKALAAMEFEVMKGELD